MPDVSARGIGADQDLQGAPVPVQTASAVAAMPASSPFQRIGFYLLLAFLFIAQGRPFDFYLSSLHMPLIISILALLSAFLSGNLLSSLGWSTTRFMLAFFAWMSLATVFSSWRGGSVNLMLSSGYKAALVYFLVTSLISTYQEAVQTMRTIFLAIVELAVLAMLIGVYPNGRVQLPQGQYTNPNDLGLAILTGLLLCWFMIHNPQQGLAKQIFGLLSLPLLVLILGRTGSRAAMIAAAVVLPIVFFRYALLDKLKFLLVCFGAAALLVTVLPGTIVSRFTTLFEVDADPNQSAMELQAMAAGSSAQRLRMLQDSLLITLRHPLFGVGPGMFAQEQADMAAVKNVRADWRGTHNTYTEISSENGIPALVFFLGVLVSCWRALASLRRLNRAHAHPRRAEIDAACFTLRICLLGDAVLLMFTHQAYSITVPLIAGLSTALAMHGQDSIRRLAPAVVAGITPSDSAAPGPVKARIRLSR